MVSNLASAVKSVVVVANFLVIICNWCRNLPFCVRESLFFFDQTGILGYFSRLHANIKSVSGHASQTNLPYRPKSWLEGAMLLAVSQR